MARDFWITINGSLHNIGDVVEAEQIKYYGMGVDSQTDLVANLQAENARLTAENEQLRTEASRRLDVIQHQQNVVLQMLNDENLRLRDALARIEAFNPHTIEADLTPTQKKAQALLYVQAIAGLALGDATETEARKALGGE